MKHAKKILCALLAVALVFAMTAVPAFAAETETTGETVDLTKLTIRELIDCPSAALLPTVEFKVTLTPDTTVADGAKTEEGMDLFKGQALSTNNFVYGFNTGTAISQEEDGEYYAVISNSFDLSGLSFAKPGVYRYVMTAANNGAKKDTYSTYLSEEGGAELADTDYYRVDVYVTRDETSGDLAIAGYAMYPTDANGTVDTEAGKFDGDIIHEMNMNTLVIANYVEGVYADPTDGAEFTFSINIPAGGVALDLEEGSKIYYTFYDQDGKAHTTDDAGNALYVTVTGSPNAEDSDYYINGTNNQITLKHGERIVIANLPEGMIYDVKEIVPDKIDGETNTKNYVNEEGYTATRSLRTTVTQAGAEEKVDSFGTNVNGTICDHINQVDFWNTKPGTIPTGIQLEVLPYVMVVAIAAAGGVLFVCKKRKTDR
jgi:hypothetical protein